LKTHFDSIAQDWDNDYRIKRAKIIAEKIKSSVPFNKNDKVLDYGCGTGLISFNLLDVVGSITFIDNSDEMLSIINNKIKLLYEEIDYLINNDIFSNTHSLEIFDCIYTSMVLHHVVDIDSLGIRFNQLLKKNGILCIVDLTTDDGTFHMNEPGFNGYNGFDPLALSNRLKKYGFIEQKREIFFSDTKQKNGKNISYSLFILNMKRDT